MFDELMARKGLQAVFHDVTALNFVTPDDPPVFMFYKEPEGRAPDDAPVGRFIHSPIFGHKLKAMLDERGIENVYHHASEFRGDVNAEMIEFFKK